MRGKKLTIILGATALLVAGCGSPETATKPETSTEKTTNTSVAAAPTARPSSPLSPDGFGAKPPTSEQLRELGAWIDGPGKGARAATDAAGEGIDKMTEAADARDAPGLRNACKDVTDPLMIRLPASLPAPDQDVTNALQFLVDDAKVLAAACDVFGDPPTESQLTAVVDAMDQLGSDLKTAGQIIIRDGDLLRSAAGRS